MGKKKILFTGYAQVHFVCFLPVYKRLMENPDVEVYLSGGFRRKEGEEVTFEEKGFYDPFPVNRENVLSLENIRNEHFDVLVSAHLSDTLFPGSVGKTVQIFHGVSFKNLAVREKALRFDMLCLPGRYHAELYRKNGLIRKDGSRCFLTGFPKTDSLVAGGLDRNAVLKAIGADPARKTVLFAPTGEKNNALDTMGHEIVKAVSGGAKWNLLVKPHDHPKKQIDWFKELAVYEKSGVHLVRDIDIEPYLFASDLLITDASSVAVEYTLMDRPIIFMDVPKLFKKLIERAPALDLDTYGRKIGRIVKSPDELTSAIEAGLSAKPGEGDDAGLRRKMATDVFYEPGKAVERVAGVVSYAAGVGDSLPRGVEELAPDDKAVSLKDADGR